MNSKPNRLLLRHRIHLTHNTLLLEIHTNTYNIAGADGSVMVPVLSETGSLMAYVLYPDTTGILQEHYSCMSIFRQSLDHSQRIPRQSNTHSSSTWGGTLYQGAPFIHKNAFGCTGQPINGAFVTGLYNMILGSPTFLPTFPNPG